MIAALEGHADIVDLLLEAGADASLVDAEGSTALSLARSSGNLDVAAKLAAAAP
jgi:ankyrin repeat protein